MRLFRPKTLGASLFAISLDRGVRQHRHKSKEADLGTTAHRPDPDDVPQGEFNAIPIEKIIAEHNARQKANDPLVNLADRPTELVAA